MKKEISKHHPHVSQPYFLYDIEDYGFVYFKTKKDRDAAASESIDAYLDIQDGWDENAVGVIVGKLTGQAAMVDVEIPDGDLDEESIDEAGKYWDSDKDYKCNYKIKPLGFVCSSTEQLKTKE